ACSVRVVSTPRCATLWHDDTAGRAPRERGTGVDMERARKECAVAESGWEPRFEAFAEDVIAKGQIPGVAVALAHDGETVYEHGFGHRDAAGSLPVTPDTRFGLGSVTKSFPALAIVQLEEAGKLSVNDPVTRWLPEFRLP